MHGAMGSATQFDEIIPLLDGKWERIHRFDFSGHGANPFRENFSMSQCAAEVLAYLDENSIQKTDVFGYSMGGYAALCAAAQAPKRFARIATLATKYAWTPEIARQEGVRLDPEAVIQKVPAFAEELARRHTAADWKELMRQTAVFLEELGRAPLLTPEVLDSIPTPALILLGDGDKMVSREESKAAAEDLQFGVFRQMENTRHPWEQTDIRQLAGLLKAYF